jgi:hypothetical protein
MLRRLSKLPLATNQACTRRGTLAETLPQLQRATPKIEVVGRSKKVEQLFWDIVTQVRADLAGVPRK